MISIAHLKKHLKTSIKPIYVCVGGDLYLNNLAHSYIKAEIFPQEADDFNYNVFVGESCALEVKDTVESLPFMSDKRLVVFKNLEKMTASHWENLTEILDRPCESSVLVLFLKKIDKRLKLYKSLSKCAEFINTSPPYDNQMPQWVSFIAETYNLKLTNEQNFLIRQVFGTKLGMIDLELKKLSSFVKDPKNVQSKELAEVLSHCHLDNIFDLTKAIASQDCGKSLRLLVDLLDLGQSEVGIIGLVARHFRLLREVKLLLGEGLSSSQISKEVGIPSFFLQEYLSQNAKWTSAQLNKTLELLYETDKALKTKPVASHLWLENFIVQVCG
ncbi:MAG: DNA polymerase III subunit delta [Bdellovibrionaceae bacterium]|nr:DNA polymerase III subunit delta [Pseudobdellovibrionaceae bacterium]